MASDLIRMLLTRSDASGSKSTVLKSLTWFIGLILATLVALALKDAAMWILILIATLLVSAVILFFYVYVYCLKHNPDALRSEGYSIKKMAIEKGFYGDNQSGEFLDEGERTIHRGRLDRGSSSPDSK